MQRVTALYESSFYIDLTPWQAVSPTEATTNSVVSSSNSISRTELKELKLHQHLHLNGDESSEESQPGPAEAEEVGGLPQLQHLGGGHQVSAFCRNLWQPSTQLLQ